MRVMSRILVLTDSMSPLDRPWAMEARIWVRWPTMRRWSVTNDSMRQRRAQATHLSSASAAWSTGSLKTVRKPFLEEVGAVEPRVGLGDPRQLHLLAIGEVLRVLPQCVPCASQCQRWSGGHGGAPAMGPPVIAGVTAAAGGVPRLATHGIHCLGGPADDVKRVGASHRGRGIDRGPRQRSIRP